MNHENLTWFEECDRSFRRSHSFRPFLWVDSSEVPTLYLNLCQHTSKRCHDC
ncbi:MAG: hypothetical protein HC773_11950 [Scytonema sp. CRU_2_7]|nr:hypothetical protein [Scytonema sp. CRU_2_7]